MTYTTVGAVKTYLDVQTTDWDVLLADIVDAAQTAINRYTRRVFEAAVDTTRTFDALGPHVTGNGGLYFDGQDLCAVTQVLNGDGVEVTTAQYTTMPRTLLTDVNHPDYHPYYGIQLLSNSGLSWTYDAEWMGAISITGRWAYSASPPDSIVQAALRLASFYFRQKDQQLFDTTVIEAGVVARPLGFPLDVKQLLDPFRKVAL